MLLTVLFGMGSSTAWAAENDTHDFSQSLSQLLNNDASIASIDVAEQSYPVKKVIVSYRYNKTLTNAVTVEVTVNGTSWGTQNVVGTDKNYETLEFTGDAAKGEIEISFTNNTGTGTGHGTFYVNNVQLVEGAAAPSYTITAVSSNDSYGTVALDGTTITATPGDGYRVVAGDGGYTVTSGTATVTNNGDNTFSVSASADCTVQINFEAIPSHTATFSVNGDTTSDTFEEGAAIVFPGNPSAISSKVFRGWVTTPIVGTTDEAPAFVNTATQTMGESNVTYYAVFADVIPGEENDFALTIDADEHSAGFPTSYKASDDYTLSGMSFNITQAYDNATKLQWRAKGNANGTGAIYNNDALHNIQSIVLTYDASDTNKNFTIEVGDAKNPTGGTSVTPSISGSVYTFDCSSYHKDYFVLTNGEYAGYLTSIVINYKTGTPDTYSAYCTTVVAAAVEKPAITVTSPFNFSTEVSMSCETGGATIYYTLDGTEPTSGSTEYSAPFDINATTTIKAIAIKGLDESGVTTVTATKQLAIPTVTVSGDLTLDLNGGTDVNAGTLTASVTYDEAPVGGATVTWSSSAPAVATIDAETGVVTLLTAGEVTFTATYAGNSDYAEKTGTRTVTVFDSKAPGSETNPYTVAQARAAIDAGTGITNVYATGIVSEIVTAYNPTYHNITYNISADGLTTSDQLQAFRGKSYDGDDFTSEDDIQVGDVVVVYGTLTKYSSTYEFTQNNQLVSLVRKTASNLTLTSDAEVELERTSANANPTSDITWTTSSTGAITCVSSNDAVATVTNAGVITAVGEGSATITISQAADEDYKAGQASVTVNVTDNRSAVVTGIDLPAAQKTLTVGDANEFAPTGTIDGGFLGTLVYTYATSNASVVAVADNLFSAEAPGTADITITVTPTSGNADSYKQASQVVAVTVNGTNSISLDLTSKTQAYGAGAFDITANVPTANYDGTVTAESSNVNVATVSVVGTTVTVTPVAVGDATITVTAGAGTYYLDPASTTCEVTVTAPEGSGTAKAAGNLVLFGESFGDNSEKARDWNDSYSVKSGVAAVYSGITGYEVSNVKQGKNTTGSVKSGLNQSTQGTDAYIIIGPLNVADYSNMTLTYQWKAASIGATYSTSAFYKTSAEGEFTEIEGTGAGATTFVERSYAVPAAAQVSTLYLKIVWNTSNTQAIIDEVKLTAPSSSEAVTLNSYGYATFCSVYPLDGTQTGDYSLWTVTDVEGTVITFTKVTGAFEGGQGVLVKGAAGATVNIPSVDSDVELTGNLLIGTTAPTFVAAGAVYGLSGEAFVPSNAAGNIPAGKAYLTAASVSEAKALTFVFVDETTGITETRPATREEVESIFNLGGQRMSKLQRGINIVNGRKVLVK